MSETVSDQEFIDAWDITKPKPPETFTREQLDTAVAVEREACAEWLRERARGVLAEAKKLPLGETVNGGGLHGASAYNVQGKIYEQLMWAGDVLVRARGGTKEGT